MTVRAGRRRRRVRYDLAVLGGGTAGLVAALGAAGVGARVVLCERSGRTGGDCLWTGCVPSKSLLAAAELAHRMRTAGNVGLEPVEPEIDFARVMAHVHGAQRWIEPHDSVERLRREGVEVVLGEARFTGPGRIVAGGGGAPGALAEGGKAPSVAPGDREIAFRSALIATGSRPVIPPIEGLAEASPLTSETIWDLDALPARLVVLGGGPIGCELAQAFARLGSRVAIVEQAAGLLPAEEDEARALIAERFAAEGIEVHAPAQAVRVEHGAEDEGAGRDATREHSAGDRPMGEPSTGHRGSGDRALVLQAEDGGECRLPFDRILVAAGREPASQGLGLEAVAVERDARGAVRIDERMRTSAQRIFAAGDVTGTLPFTHVGRSGARGGR